METYQQKTYDNKIRYCYTEFKSIDDLKDLDVLKGIDVLEELDFENLKIWMS